MSQFMKDERVRKMHKLYLTSPECEIIRGSSEIVAIIGGFPSMEDGKLIDVTLKRHNETGHRGDVMLTFDISGWKRIASAYTAYGSLHQFAEDRIRLTFRNMRDIKIVDPFFESGEIKFSNTCDSRKMHQDDHPCNTPIVERPFCRFYIRSGHNIVLDFKEEECEISAELFCSNLKSTTEVL